MPRYPLALLALVACQATPDSDTDLDEPALDDVYPDHPFAYSGPPVVVVRDAYAALRVLDPESGAVLLELPGGDGQPFAACTGDQVVRLRWRLDYPPVTEVWTYDPATDETLRERELTGQIFQFVPREEQFLITDSIPSLALIDPVWGWMQEHADLLPAVYESGRVIDLDADDAYTWAVATASRDGRSYLTAVDPSTWEVVAQQRVFGGARGLVAYDGAAYVIGDREVSAFEVGSDEVRTLYSGESIADAVLDRAGRGLWIVDVDEDGTALHRVGFDGEVQHTLHTDFPVQAVSQAADGNLWASSGAAVRELDPDTGAVVHTLTLPANALPARYCD